MALSHFGPYGGAKQLDTTSVTLLLPLSAGFCHCFGVRPKDVVTTLPLYMHPL